VRKRSAEATASGGNFTAITRGANCTLSNFCWLGNELEAEIMEGKSVATMIAEEQTAP
jgi:hypothetical protein